MPSYVNSILIIFNNEKRAFIRHFKNKAKVYLFYPCCMYRRASARNIHFILYLLYTTCCFPFNTIIYIFLMTFFTKLQVSTSGIIYVNVYSLKLLICHLNWNGIINKFKPFSGQLFRVKFSLSNTFSFFVVPLPSAQIFIYINLIGFVLFTLWFN